MSQAHVAERAGISQAMLCQIERGTKNPSLQISVLIAGILGCRVEDLASDSLAEAQERTAQAAAQRGQKEEIA